MTNTNRKTPNFFSENVTDPVESATGRAQHSSGGSKAPQNVETEAQSEFGSVAKKKAGFYLSVDILERFTLKFYELKLAGVAIENKSTLLELAIAFALDDLDKGEESRVLKNLEN
jgi:hypothetical protein